MRPLTREEVRAVDQAAIRHLGVRGLVLMENAGRNAADAIERFLGATGLSPVGRGMSAPPMRGEGLLPSRPAGVSPASGDSEVRHPQADSFSLGGAEDGPVPVLRRVAIVAGAGNNGGDGFVVARHLAMRGAAVTIFLVAPPEKIAGDAAANLAILRKLGHAIVSCESKGPGNRAQAPFSNDEKGVSPHFRAIPLLTLAEELRGYDVIVDAIGGTGIQGALRGETAVAVEQVNAAGRPVVALDIPTGLDCDTGQAVGATIRAAMTVTFVARKKGFDAPGSERFTGEVIVADIGIPAEIAWKIG